MGLYFLRCLLLVTFIYVSVLVIPTTYHQWIRDYVGQSVVEVTDIDGTTGGTGFHVILPSGKIAIMTNAHVCRHQVNGIIYISDEDYDLYPRKVILSASYTDLCMIEALPDIKPLSLAQYAYSGEPIIEIGHPQLLPLTLSYGELISKEIVDIDGITTEIYNTTVPTMHGNSGSPIVNIYGDVVGVICAKDSESNWGSAITLEDIHKFILGY